MNTSIALQLLIGLLSQANALGSLISKAQAEGRDLTEDELDLLSESVEAAKKRLQDSIDTSLTPGS